MSELFHLNLDDLRAAERNLAGRLLQTPVLPSQVTSGVYFKAENLQKTGSFKVRAAFNQLAGLSRAELDRGIVTSSSGNFAQAAAFAAAQYGVSAKIVMMAGSSPLKVARTRSWGGDVVFCENHFEARAAMVAQIHEQEGRVVIHPYDHPAVVAGNGTAGLEILNQLPTVRHVAVPISGGGLIAGVAWAVKQFQPEVRLWGVQPTGSNAAFLSFQAGHRVSIPQARTIADGLQVTCPGELTFEGIRRYVDAVVTVSEEAIRAAVKQFLTHERLVVEPSGAVPLAAVLEGAVPAEETVCLVSGGNIQPALARELLTD